MIARQSQKYATRHTTHLEGRTNHHDDCYIVRQTFHGTVNEDTERNFFSKSSIINFSYPWYTRPKNSKTIFTSTKYKLCSFNNIISRCWCKF